MRAAIALTILTAAAIALGGCARTQMTWIRADGQPVTQTQLELDKTICLGEAQKANISGVSFHTGGMAGIAAEVERSNAAGDVGKGCMAQKGYLSRVAQPQAQGAPVAQPAPSYQTAPPPAYAAPYGGPAAPAYASPYGTRQVLPPVGRY